MKSLVFGGATSDRVNCATDARLTGATNVTIWGWVYVTTLTGGRGLVEKSRDGSGNLAWLLRLDGGSGNIGLIRLGSGSNQVVTTNDTPLTTDAWYFIAVTAAWGAAAGHIYVGTPSALAAARSLGENTAGGTQTTDSGGGLIIGNRAANNAAFPGREAVLGIHPRVLSLGELHALQFDPRVLGDGPLYRLGENGTGTQYDVSGGAGDGTVTGATLSDGPALRRWRRRGQLWMPPTVVPNDTTLAAVATCSIGASAALSTDIRLAGAAALAVSAAGALTTEIHMAGAAQLTVSAAGALQTEVRLSGTATLAVQTAGAFGTDIRMAAAAQLAVSAVGALSTEIRMAGAASLVITTVGALDAPALLAGAAPLTISAAGALTTAIELAGAASCTVGAVGVLSTDIRLAGAAALVVTSTGALATAIRLAGSAVCEILATGALEVGVAVTFSRWAVTDCSVPAYRLRDASVSAYALADRSVPAFRLRNAS